MSRVLDHVRTCGSFDVYLIGTSRGWCIVSGVELVDAAALAHADAGNTPDGQLRAPASVLVLTYSDEATALAEFDKARG